MHQDQKIPQNQQCPECLRPRSICLCGKIEKLTSGLKVVILQHPAEQDKLWNSSRLAHTMIDESLLCVGLSWPNLKKIAGPNATGRRWGVLHIKGSDTHDPAAAPVQVFKRNKPMTDFSKIEGIVVLDGSWKQAKALWWRNPWLVRLLRIHLSPDHPSLRTQTKSSGLSTIESIALAALHLKQSADVAEKLISAYRIHIIEPSTQYLKSGGK